jgi:hypothetical protein
MKRKLLILLLGALCLGASPLQALDSPVKILSLQAGGVGVFQSGGGNSFSGTFAWTPIVEVAGFGIRGELGASLLKANFGDKFLTFNYEAFLRIPIIPFFGLEGGGGFETWRGNGGTNPKFSANLIFKMIGLERIYVGYSRYFLPGTATNFIRAGIGFLL